MISSSYVLLANDQPVTCPKCGARTNIILDLSHTTNQTQVHRCLNRKCTNLFVVEKD